MGEAGLLGGMDRPHPAAQRGPVAFTVPAWWGARYAAHGMGEMGGIVESERRRNGLDRLIRRAQLRQRMLNADLEHELLGRNPVDLTGRAAKAFRGDPQRGGQGSDRQPGAVRCADTRESRLR